MKEQPKIHVHTIFLLRITFDCNSNVNRISFYACSVNKLPFTEHRKILSHTRTSRVDSSKCAEVVGKFYICFLTSVEIPPAVVKLLDRNESVSPEFFVYRHEIQVIYTYPRGSRPIISKIQFFPF